MHIGFLIHQKENSLECLNAPSPPLFKNAAEKTFLAMFLCCVLTK